MSERQQRVAEIPGHKKGEVQRIFRKSKCTRACSESNRKNGSGLLRGKSLIIRVHGIGCYHPSRSHQRNKHETRIKSHLWHSSCNPPTQTKSQPGTGMAGRNPSPPALVAILFATGLEHLLDDTKRKDTDRKRRRRNRNAAITER